MINGSQILIMKTLTGLTIWVALLCYCCSQQIDHFDQPPFQKPLLLPPSDPNQKPVKLIPRRVFERAPSNQPPLLLSSYLSKPQTAASPLKKDTQKITTQQKDQKAAAQIKGNPILEINSDSSPDLPAASSKRNSKNQINSSPASLKPTSSDSSTKQQTLKTLSLKSGIQQNKNEGPTLPQDSVKNVPQPTKNSDSQTGSPIWPVHLTPLFPANVIRSNNYQNNGSNQRRSTSVVISLKSDYAASVPCQPTQNNVGESKSKSKGQGVC